MTEKIDLCGCESAVSQCTPSTTTCTAPHPRATTSSVSIGRTTDSDRFETKYTDKNAKKAECTPRTSTCILPILQAMQLQHVLKIPIRHVLQVQPLAKSNRSNRGQQHILRDTNINEKKKPNKPLYVFYEH